MPARAHKRYHDDEWRHNMLLADRRAEYRMLEEEVRRSLDHKIFDMKEADPRNFDIREFLSQELVEIDHDIHVLQQLCKELQDDIDNWMFLDEETYLMKVAEGVEYCTKLRMRRSG